MRLGHLLEISGEVGAREGVLLAADIGDEFGKGALGVGLGALEHQVFKEMGDARLARRIVSGAVAIPDHMRDHGSAMIRNDQDFEAVLKGEMRHMGGRSRLRRHRDPFALEKARRDGLAARGYGDDRATYKLRKPAAPAGSWGGPGMVDSV